MRVVSVLLASQLAALVSPLQTHKLDSAVTSRYGDSTARSCFLTHCHSVSHVSRVTCPRLAVSRDTSPLLVAWWRTEYKLVNRVLTS